MLRTRFLVCLAFISLKDSFGLLLVRLFFCPLAHIRLSMLRKRISCAPCSHLLKIPFLCCYLHGFTRSLTYAKYAAGWVSCLPCIYQPKRQFLGCCLWGCFLFLGGLPDFCFRILGYHRRWYKWRYIGWAKLVWVKDNISLLVITAMPLFKIRSIRRETQFLQSFLGDFFSKKS